MIRRTLFALLLCLCIAAAPAPASVVAGSPALVDDLCSGECSSGPRWLTPHADALYLTTLNFGNEGATGLWRYTPGEAHAERLAPGHFTQLVTAGDDLFAVFQETFVEAVEADGDLRRLLEVPLGIVDPAVAVGDRLFVPGGTLTEEQALWVTDGTAAGTRLLGAWQESCPAFPGDKRVPPDSLTAAGDTLFFVLYDPEGGCGTELWKSDGTVEGTIPVGDVALSSNGRLAALGNRVVYSTLDGTLWVSDGTAEGTTPIATFPSSSPHPVSAGDLVYLHAQDETEARSLWRTDGTPAGTFRLTGDTGQPVLVGGGLVLFTRVDGGRLQLWRSDGTAGGTELVRDLGPAGTLPVHLTALGGGLAAFTADDGVHGAEPWLTDGTPAGTLLLGDVRSGPAGSGAQGFAALAGALYFSADDGSRGRELWSVPFSTGDGNGPAPPPPADASEIFAPELGGFRLWVRISNDGQVIPARPEPACIPETVCVSGALPGRSELFVRIVGPKPNGRLWPTLVRFSTSTIDVWLEQLGTGELRHYRLEGASPGSSELDGLFDRDGFLP